MDRVLVISGHPELDSSHANRRILDVLAGEHLGIEVRRLDLCCPNFQVHIEAEQEALINADVVVLQFPFYWYSVPSLLKHWLDQVFTFNFAYGPQGDKLKGKDFLLSFTIGGPQSSYDPLGYNHFTIEQLLHPLQQTAYLAGMNYQAPIYSYQMVYIPNIYNKLEEVHARADQHAHKLLASLQQLIHCPQRQIQRFVKAWFATFETLPEEMDYFIEHLAPEVNLHLPEGTFHGHIGFRQWYQHLRQTLKQPISHVIEQVEITDLSHEYHVHLLVKVEADTYVASHRQGAHIQILADQHWRLTFNEQQQVILHDYHVRVVDEHQ